MSLKYGEQFRNDILESYNDNFNPGIRISMWSGAAPATADEAATGTLLAEGALNTALFGNAAAGAIAQATQWAVSVVDDGDLGYYRIWNSDDTQVYIQGTITATGGGGDMTIGSISVVNGQTLVVNTYEIVAGNA